MAVWLVVCRVETQSAKPASKNLVVVADTLAMVESAVGAHSDTLPDYEGVLGIEQIERLDAEAIDCLGQPVKSRPGAGE